MNNLLADSSYYYALHDASDPYHSTARAFGKLSGTQMLVADIVLGEVVFLVKRNGGVPAMLSFLDNFISSDAILVPITKPDLRHVREIEAAYAQAKLDFVDCCIMALSERLNITQVCTFDRRDFSIFRPRHCDYLELLP